MYLVSMYDSLSKQDNVNIIITMHNSVSMRDNVIKRVFYVFWDIYKCRL